MYEEGRQGVESLRRDASPVPLLLNPLVARWWKKIITPASMLKRNTMCRAKSNKFFGPRRINTSNFGQHKFVKSYFVQDFLNLSSLHSMLSSHPFLFASQTHFLCFDLLLSTSDADKFSLVALVVHASN